MVGVDGEHGGLRVAFGDHDRRQAERRGGPAPSRLDDEALLGKLGELLADTPDLRPFGDDVNVVGQPRDAFQRRLEQRLAPVQREQVLGRLLA